MIVLLVLCSLSTFSALATPRSIYVSTTGNDAWTGVSPTPAYGDGPVATLERARDIVREIKQNDGLPKGGIVVLLAPGLYQLKQPLVLTSEDSGTLDSPIIYRADPTGETRLSGGRTIKGFSKVNDPTVLERLPLKARDHILQIDLRAQNITSFGELTRRGMSQPIREAHSELFFKHQPMVLARWPNDEYITIEKVLDGRYGHRIGYRGDRPLRWGKEPDIWAHGYWYHSWADEYLPVVSIDPERNVLKLPPDRHHYGYRSGQPFYFLNVLAELDRPGEWFLDRKQGVLYFWPPSPLDSGDVEVSLLPTLLRMTGTNQVHFEGMVFELARGTGIIINGGQDNRISRCTIRNLGNQGIKVSGTNNGVTNCQIYNTGDGGIVLKGGDRQTLKPAGLFAFNNHIHHFNRWSFTYRPAIQAVGVGNTISHNLIHDGPHNAIQFLGNDHIIEFNEIHSVALETKDVGAIYTGRDWTARGTVIRHNYIHHISGSSDTGSQGIYLDDQASEIKIYGNIFYDVYRGVLIGGGRDIIVTNNLFVDCKRAGVHLDARGLRGQKKATQDPNQTLQKRLRAVPYDQPPYTLRYPNLANLLNDDLGTPKYNVVTRNISVGGNWLDIRDKEKHLHLQLIEKNLVNENPGLVFTPRKKSMPRPSDFAFKSDALAYSIGFEPLPLEAIGLIGEMRFKHKP